MIEYIISEKAVEDLNNIWLYTAKNWSTAQADYYYNLIMDEIEFVVADYNFTIAFNNSNYRYSKVKSHLVFYKKNIADEIIIVRILHEKMDIQNRLKD